MIRIIRIIIRYCIYFDSTPASPNKIQWGTGRRDAPYPDEREEPGGATAPTSETVC